ncbi:hypothetical protein CPI28_05735, partial [Moraxella catarrhalis]|nr:hypothetical protein [Moraxella catarrhalis]
GLLGGLEDAVRAGDVGDRVQRDVRGDHDHHHGDEHLPPGRAALAHEEQQADGRAGDHCRQRDPVDLRDQLPEVLAEDLHRAGEPGDPLEAEQGVQQPHARGHAHVVQAPEEVEHGDQRVAGGVDVNAAGAVVQG